MKKTHVSGVSDGVSMGVYRQMGMELSLSSESKNALEAPYSSLTETEVSM